MTDDPLPILKREYLDCDCGREYIQYDVKKKDGNIVKTNIHRCSFGISQGLDGHPIGKRKNMI